MTDFVRTEEENFADLPNFPHAPHYHQWQDLRMHYVDEGPRDGPVRSCCCCTACRPGRSCTGT